MKLQLADFQAEAVQRLVMRGGQATRDAHDGDRSAVVFAAPTGSGKTVMTAAWMEALVEGTETTAPDPDATFLWITDQPELNEQTRRKFQDASTVFDSARLVTVDGDLVGPTLEPGKVYFLNTQKLGKNSTLVSHSDGRQHTIWEIIANTLADRPTSFWVVIDEAHRGMSDNRRNEARTLIQRFILGHPESSLAPAPLIFGVTATPQRFEDLLKNTERTQRRVEVAPDQVRSSGLLKDTLTLFYPEESQPSDLTLLAAAARRLQQYDDRWAAWTAAGDPEPPRQQVRPILVVQVADATKTSSNISATPLADCLDVLEEHLGPLADHAIGHAFQEQTSLEIGTVKRALRYVAPSDIQDDQDLRVVFFKSSLTTGWDCPRAEVMMSFRRAVDLTLIAQLVGRMVRTPLAHRIEADDFLNTVSLYLPHYDAEAVDRVIKYLSDDDDPERLGVGVQLGNHLVQLNADAGLADVFAHAGTLPNYKVERTSKQSAVRRLLRLGRELAWDKLDAAALQTFTASLLQLLDDRRTQVEGTADYQARVQDAATIDVRELAVAYGDPAQRQSTSTTFNAVTQNIDRAFAEAGRKLAGGMHLAYLKARAEQPSAPSVATIKQELYALTQDPEVLQAAEAHAEQTLQDAYEHHKAQIRLLPEERRQRYRQIRRAASKPQDEPWTLPTSVELPQRTNDPQYASGHLYTDTHGQFDARLNSWETQVLHIALNDPETAAWLRNVERKPWALSTPYELNAEQRPLYPDFVVFRRTNGTIVADILEPHGLHLTDAVAKAKGLADYADDHREDFGRIQLIAKEGSELRALNLHDPAVCAKVRAVSSDDHLRQLFADEGTPLT